MSEAIDRINANQPAASLGLRLALAQLYATRDQRSAWFDREPYDAIWQAAIEAEQLLRDGKASNRRSAATTAAFNGIMRAAGVDATADTYIAISRAGRAGIAPREPGIAPRKAAE